jgi:hypothetical protein
VRFDALAITPHALAITNHQSPITNLAQEERDFLANFVPSDFGSIEQLAAQPPLSPVELEETSSGATRESMLMLAWTVALTDEELDANEEAILQRFANFSVS